jgi:hypothetical protein
MRYLTILITLAAMQAGAQTPPASKEPLRVGGDIISPRLLRKVFIPR